MGLLDEIKKEAKKTFTRIQSTQETELEHKLNSLHYLDKNIEHHRYKRKNYISISASPDVE